MPTDCGEPVSTSAPQERPQKLCSALAIGWILLTLAWVIGVEAVVGGSMWKLSVGGVIVGFCGVLPFTWWLTVGHHGGFVSAPARQRRWFLSQLVFFVLLIGAMSGMLLEYAILERLAARHEQRDVRPSRPTVALELTSWGAPRPGSLTTPSPGDDRCTHRTAVHVEQRS